MTFDEEILFLQERIAEYGITLSPDQAGHFHIYLSELMEWGRKINLTGLSSPKRIITELFFDSLIPAPFLPCRGKMLDIGSGAGIPALPIKIVRPDLDAHLLEPNSKKNSFLKHIIRLLKLEQIMVIKGRIERDGALLFPGGYDLITVRALTDPATAINWYSPFLRPGGMAVHFLGADFKQSLQQAGDRIENIDLMIHRQIDYHLPGRRDKRHIVIFQKGGPR